MKKLLFVCLLFLCACQSQNSSHFEIKDNKLIRYHGNEDTVTVPEGIKVIGKCAFEPDETQDNIRKIVLPDTVEKIEDEAFAFTYADVIIINEGCKGLGDRICLDVYLKEIHFPSTIEKTGVLLLETEEGLNDCKIYVPKGSYIESVIKQQDPYGNYEIVYE